MTSDQRLHQLTIEMIDRMKHERTVFSTDLYADILDVTLTVLVSEVSPDLPLDEECLDNVQAVKGVVDEALVQHMRQQLESEALVAEFVPFFEQLVEVIPRTIARWKAAGCYHSVWDNAFVQLFGLHHRDFIDRPELRHIATTPEFNAFAASSRLDELFDVALKVHFRADGRLSDKQYAAEIGMSNAIAIWHWLEFLADQPQWRSAHYLGLSRLWWGRALAVEKGNSAETKALIESALDVLTDRESRGDRHDALIDLLAYEEQLAPERVQEIIAEVHTIRAELAPGNP